MLQGAGIEDIRLGQLPHGFGNVTRLARVDHDDRQARRRQRRHHGPLVASSRFEHNELRVNRQESRHEGSDPRLPIGDRPAFARGAEGHVSLSFGDIDTNKDLGRHTDS